MLILADDYTGAADAAVGLTEHGFSTSIQLQSGSFENASQVVALDLDTRHRTPQEAAARVRAARVDCGAQDFVFKKIDSTLRGHIGAELRALHDASAKNPVPMLVAPAVPENGRVVVGGRVLVRGVALEQTDIWAHERAGALCDLPARLSERLISAGLRTAEIHLRALHDGGPALKARLLDLGRTGIEAVVVDSRTAHDLSLIAETAVSFERMPVCVGAAGLSRAFGQLLQPRDIESSRVRHGLAAPVLLAIASQARTARAQIDVLQSRRDLVAVELANTAGTEAEAEVEATVREIVNALAAGRHVLLFAPLASQDGLRRDHAATMGQIVARAIGASVGPSVGPSVDHPGGHAGALVASGGDTARACLLALGYTRIDVERELAAGVVLGHPSDRPDLAFVSKAGDFGEADTLSNCIDLLTCSSSGTVS